MVTVEMVRAVDMKVMRRALLLSCDTMSSDPAAKVMQANAAFLAGTKSSGVCTPVVACRARPRSR